MSLEIDRVTKRYGSTLALDAIQFSVPRGQIFGFLGANGAGKTTTMRICLGIIPADAGEVRWDSTPVLQLSRALWGYLPEERGLYPRLPVLDQLVYLASLYGTDPGDARRSATDWLNRFRIPDLAFRRAEELSKGNQQKVQFIAAILHDPEILLLDEPFTGLDPVNVGLLKDAIHELQERGRTIVFSTHQMELAEALCESVAIIDRGRVVAQGSVRSLKRSAGARMVRIAFEHAADPDWLEDVPGVTLVRRRADYVDVALADDASGSEVLRAVLSRGGAVASFELREPSLEALFIQLVGHPAEDEPESLAS